MVFQGFQAVFGNLDAFTFVLERAGNHSHSQDTQLTGNLGHYRSSAGTGAAAHTGGNEQHIGALNGVSNSFTVFQSGIAAGFRIRTGTQTFGQISTQLDALGRFAALQRLGIGVGTNKLNALHRVVYHIVNSITATATNTDNFNDRRTGCGFDNIINQLHLTLLLRPGRLPEK